MPNWDESDNWDEFEWEHALKYSDDLASRCFRMLQRFGDLPNADELIAARLGDHQLFEFTDDDFDEDEFDDDDLWEDEDAPILSDELDECLEDGMSDSPENIRPGDSLYFESCPVFIHARQVALDWCNILSVELSPADRAWGLRVLMMKGRIMSYLALSIGDGTFDRLRASIAFAKRAIHQLNQVMGEIQQQMETSPAYVSVFKLVHDNLLHEHEMLINYLLDCRNRQRDGGEDTAF